MRRLVVGAVLVALGLMALPAFVAPGYSAARAALDAGRIVLTGGAGVFVVLALRTASATGPTGFIVRPAARSFVVPASRAYGLTAIAQLAWFTTAAGLVVDHWAHPGAVGHSGRGFVLFETGSAVVAAAWIAMCLGSALRGRPALELTPDGLLVRDPFGSRTFPWDALRPGTPGRAFDTVKLDVVRPELVRRSGWSWRSRRIGLRFAIVHPWFFTDAVRFYVLHPERRSTIGTPEEFTWLLVDLGVLVPAS